jgi:D-alanyl-D-alanine carboxypeptidase/D-alanyl-D-alanine-endopeptidase (penicillin-binding protein 4)
MTKLLHFLRNRSYFPQVWEALAIAGVDGTLRERMKGTAAEGVLRAKTGTLNGTYNLAGYVPKKENDGTISDYIPFVIMTQTTSDQKAAAKAVADRVGTTLTEIVSAQPSLVFIFKN